MRMVTFLLKTISIHVPAWGTTPFTLRFIVVNSDFNPRSRVGNDLFLLLINQVTVISIHVPAWGTTKSNMGISFCFGFQSTFPRGERHRWDCNSYKGNTISIHVPAWGTTSNFSLPMIGRYISIHVPAWGTTSCTHLNSTLFLRFQSTFPRGERL